MTPDPTTDPAEDTPRAAAEEPRVEIEVRRPPTNVVSFRLNNEEMDLVEAEADRRGLRLSQYVRSVLLADVKAAPRAAKAYDQTKELT